MAKNSIVFNLKFESNGTSVMQKMSAELADVRKAVESVSTSAKDLKGVWETLSFNSIGAVAVNNLLGQARSAVGSLAESWQDFDEGMRKAPETFLTGR